MSKQLNLLSDAGLLEIRRDGTRRLYRVNREAFGELQDFRPASVVNLNRVHTCESMHPETGSLQAEYFSICAPRSHNRSASRENNNPARIISARGFVF